MAVTTRQIAAQVIESLGLPECKVTRIKLEMRHDDVVRVEVEMLPTEQEAIGVFDVIKRYELVEREETSVERCMPKFGNALRFSGHPQIPGWRDRIDQNVSAAREAIELMAQQALYRIEAPSPVMDALRAALKRTYGPRKAPWPFAH